MVAPSVSKNYSRDLSADVEKNEGLKPKAGSSDTGQAEGVSCTSSARPSLDHGRGARQEAKTKGKAKSGRVLSFVVEDCIPDPVQLVLPEHVRHRWSVRLIEAAGSAAALGKPWKNAQPPLRWYSTQLLRLCTGTSTLSMELMALKVQRNNRPWMWQVDGPLSTMLTNCCDMLMEACSVIEAVSVALNSLDVLLDAREICLPARLREPAVPPCLGCMGEEAMEMAQNGLARLRGAGAALGAALRFDAGECEVLKGTQLQKDFFIVVPFVEMALSNLCGLVKLVFGQLEVDAHYVPVDLGNDSPAPDPTTKSLLGSLSFQEAWAAQDSSFNKEERPQEEGLEDHAEDLEQEDLRHEPSELDMEGLKEGSDSMKASRKPQKKKTTSKVGKKKSVK